MGKKTNKYARQSLIALYGARCMLTGVKSKQLTYHHTLVKDVDGGDSSVENGSLLVEAVHKWLHCEPEMKDNELYWLINECLTLYKQCRDMQLSELVQQFEEEVQPEVAERVRRLGGRKC